MSLPAVRHEELAVVDPRTGELVDTPAQVADVHRYCRDQRDALYAIQQQAAWLLGEEAKRQGKKTLHIGSHTVEVRDEKEITWDLEILGRLRDLGLPEERWDELVRATITYKVSAAVANQIAGANEKYAEIIALARTDFEKATRVSVK